MPVIRFTRGGDYDAGNSLLSDPQPDADAYEVYADARKHALYIYQPSGAVRTNVSDRDGLSIDFRDSVRSLDLGGGHKGDEIYGGHNSDRLYGASGNDILKGGVDTDALYGEAGADLLFGGKTRDGLVGGLGDDHLDGGRGNDTLNGGPGADHLKGGSGRDYFYYASLADLPEGRHLEKIFDFSGYGREFDSISLTHIANFTFIGEDQFHAGGTAELRFTPEAKDYLVSGDIDGDGHADLSFKVISDAPLTEYDFPVIAQAPITDETLASQPATHMAFRVDLHGPEAFALV